MLADLAKEDDVEGGVGSTIRTIFDQYLMSPFKGSMDADLLSLEVGRRVDTEREWATNIKEQQLARSLYQMLTLKIQQISPLAIHTDVVQPLKRIKIGGMDYSRARESKGNSQVLFRVKTDTGDFVEAAGQIETIFRHRYSPANSESDVVDHFLVISRYRELDEAGSAQDPFRRYPALDARMCHDEFEDVRDIITTDQIISHAATCPLQQDGKNFKVILNLDRVSFLHEDHPGMALTNLMVELSF